MTSISVIDLMERTLNHVDERLADHGKRVAYLVYRALKLQSNYQYKELRDICTLALIHDIGAHRPEEIDQMISFETTQTWDHGVYGYLFLRDFSPLANLAPILLVHHANVDNLSLVHRSYHDLAQILHIADRIDTLGQLGIWNGCDLYSYFYKLRGVDFKPEFVDLFFDNGLHLLSEAYQTDADFLALLYHSDFSPEQREQYLNMTLSSVDFRSRQTVAHTVTAAQIGKELARLAGMSVADIKRIETGAMLHDLGKTGVPAKLLDSTRRLGQKSIELLQAHVGITAEIITGLVDKTICKLATCQHEMLNGSGYPLGLCAGNLSQSERLLAVADAIATLCGHRSYKKAFMKPRIREMLIRMADDGLLDRDLAGLALQHLDPILALAEEAAQPVYQRYDAMQEEFESIRKKIDRLVGGQRVGLPIIKTKCLTALKLPGVGNIINGVGARQRDVRIYQTNWACNL